MPHRLRRRAAPATALAMTLLTWGAAQAAQARDRQISRDNNGGDTPVEVSAYGGVLAWSRGVDADDEGNPGFYRLVLRLNGVTRDASVRRFEDPVNPDLGAGGRGGVVAVYSRCALGGCAAYELNIRTGRERRLAAIPDDGDTDLALSVWRGGYLFTRRTPGRAGLFKTGPARRLSLATPEQTDLRGSRAAFLAQVGPRRNTETIGERDSAVVVKRLGRGGHGRRCVVARARPVELRPDGESEISSGRGFVASPVLDGRHVLWLETVTRRGRAVTTIRRRPVPARDCRRRGRERRTRGRRADSVAAHKGRVYYASPRGIFQLDRRSRFR